MLVEHWLWMIELISACDCLVWFSDCSWLGSTGIEFCLLGILDFTDIGWKRFPGSLNSGVIVVLVISFLLYTVNSLIASSLDVTHNGGIMRTPPTLPQNNW